MKLAYQRLKGLEVTHGETKGVLIGFCHDRFIGATLTSPHYSFRRLEKDSFIEEEYKDVKYRYFYISESYVENQHGIKYEVLQTNS